MSAFSHRCNYRILGTPNEETWPGVTSLQDWNEEFPIWPSLNLSKFCPGLDEQGLDLLEVRRLALRDYPSL